jgi:4'-phosphopantetheinyl transferase EntD
VIEAILPEAAVVEESFVDEGAGDLLPEEVEVVSRAVEKRRSEFATGRACAHRALRRLGIEAGAIGSGERGEPLWPEGVIGSITHCEGYRASAVARGAELMTIGIDAECHQPLPAGLVTDIARAEERAALADLAGSDPAVHWDRLLFSAKESVYKAWFPLAQRWLGFEDATLTLDPGRRRFQARLLVPGPVLAGGELRGFEGRWLVADGLVLTAIAPLAAG